MGFSEMLIPVILSGGAGSRLWPISRELHPKPFIKLADDQTLLQKTFLRTCELPHTAEIITITNKEYYLKSKAEYEKHHQRPLPAMSFLLEPVARNTAPAVTLAALKVLAQYGPNAVMIILPADHLIHNVESFVQKCQQAIQLATSAPYIVTFGIKPNRPETGFGYIECDIEHPISPDIYRANHFVEKPDRSTAQAYVQSQRYFWNAGMFCFKAGVILQQIEKYAPDLYYMAKQCWQATMMNNTNPAVLDLDANTFNTLNDISIDYAVMEKADNIAVVACDFGWHDIGSWEAYKGLHQCDDNGNTVLGEAILIDSQDNLVHSESRMVASIGVNNLAIIDTPDALLIAHRDRTQDVRDIVRTLKKNAHGSYLTHRTVIRPWGAFTVLEEGPGFKIKRLVVKPGASLSLQSHKHRCEHWVVVSGTARVVNGDTEYDLGMNESTFIPIDTPHRLSNPAITDLIIIEVQTGIYLGEDDITRFEDNYGRIS
jgi:mannose-1-phosphate guanylyltransferase